MERHTATNPSELPEEHQNDARPQDDVDARVWELLGLLELPREFEEPSRETRFLEQVLEQARAGMSPAGMSPAGGRATSGGRAMGRIRPVAATVGWTLAAAVVLAAVGMGVVGLWDSGSGASRDGASDPQGTPELFAGVEDGGSGEAGLGAEDAIAEDVIIGELLGVIADGLDPTALGSDTAGEEFAGAALMDADLLAFGLLDPGGEILDEPIADVTDAEELALQMIAGLGDL